MTEPKDLVLVFPDPPPAILARTLDLAGQRWKAVANASLAMQAEPAEGWTGAIVCAEDDPEGAFALCRTLRKGDARVESILLLVSGAQLHELEHRDDLFDDFFLSHPGKVFTREQLLSRVWGYEYYGGARTVDVHVRRLRAKLGEEHANLIQTVRSVGYRFGQTRWPGADRNQDEG